MRVCFGVILRLRTISVAFALLSTFSCTPRTVIQAFVMCLLCSAPYLVLGFPTGLNPVGSEGSNQ